MARFFLALLICISYNHLPIESADMGLANFMDKHLATQLFVMANHFGNTIDHVNLTDDFYSEFKTELGRSIDLVNVHYARKHFSGCNIIKLDVSPINENPSSPSFCPSCVTGGPRYNFVVGQKSFGQLGTSSDRWDLKVNNFGHQFVSLYHGLDPFITNRMRSYMIRWIGNGIKDYLLVLEETVDNLRDHVELVQSELKNVIRYIIRRLRKKIEDLWDDLNYFDAHETPGHPSEPLSGGSIVVVCRNYIVALNMGGGRIYVWDDSGILSDLTGEKENHDLSWFIDDKHIAGPPHIHIQSRQDFKKQKFVVLISAETAKLVNQTELTDILSSQLSNGLESEQQLFVALANGVLQMVTDKLNATMIGDEMDKSLGLDHSIVILGLDRLDNNVTNWIDSFVMTKTKR